MTPWKYVTKAGQLLFSCPALSKHTTEPFSRSYLMRTKRRSSYRTWSCGSRILWPGASFNSEMPGPSPTSTSKRYRRKPIIKSSLLPITPAQLIISYSSTKVQLPTRKRVSYLFTKIVLTSMDTTRMFSSGKMQLFQARMSKKCSRTRSQARELAI